MKKIISICTIAIGSLAFILLSLHFIYLVFQHDVIISKTEKQIILNRVNFSDEDISRALKIKDKVINAQKKIDIVLAVVGLGIAYGGFILYKKSKKEIETIDHFQID